MEKIKNIAIKNIPPISRIETTTGNSIWVSLASYFNNLYIYTFFKSIHIILFSVDEVFV